MDDTETTQIAADAQPDELLAKVTEGLLDLGLPGEMGRVGARLRPLARELLVSLDPQNAAERMLAVQMIASFGRAMFASQRINAQASLKWFKAYSEEADRAMTAFRRQMQTFAELRRPRRTTFNSIRQANIAGQQIVVNDIPQSDGQSIQETQAAISAQQIRSGGVAKKLPGKSTVGTQHRPAHTGGQEDDGPE